VKGDFHMKRCFLISPIGEEGSEVREHADDVLDFIIRPALTELGYEAYRSDHSHAVGKISDQMFNSILQDDLCVALLTFQNPNVYYELAVAQSAARPVLILALKGTNLPFDIKDMRVVYYDLKPRPLAEGVYEREIVEKVRYLENEGNKRIVPFAPGLSPLSSTKLFDSLLKAEDYGPSDRWMDTLREASTKFDLLGISLGRWTKPLGTRELFIEKANEGCRIRILIMSPDNPAMTGLMNEKDHQGSIERTKQAILETTEFFNTISENQDQIELRHIRNACPHQTIMFNDFHAVVIPYLYSNATFLSPLFDFPQKNGMYDIFASEFESLWDEAGQ
jgi:hypothetical protein